MNLNSDAAVAEASSESLTFAQWRMLILASLGGALEFYDFIIYGIFAQYIGSAFFPMADPVVALVLSFAVFAIGYLSRPLGGLILSHFGDRFGRKPVFIISVMVVSLSTLAMGFIPTYATWGVFSTALMISLRLVQGFCLGGEMPGSITYVVETVPHRAGFACAFVFFFVNLGVIFGTVANLVVQHAMSSAELSTYGWRLPFIAGGIFGLCSFWMRRKLEETREFSQMKHTAAKHPLREVLREHGKPVLIAIGATTAVAGYNGLMFAHMPAHLARVLQYDARQAALAENVALVVLSAGILFWGYMSDRMPRRFILGTGALLMVLFSYPFYLALSSHSINLTVLLSLAALAGGFTSGTFASAIADLFPTRVRFSGVAVTYNIGFTIFSGTAPLIATSLIKLTGNNAAPSAFMAFCATLTVIAVFFLKRFSGKVVNEN
ncbi:MFS transporter [Paraburkholderia sp. MPAMCS5]|uniref:MFS transporter n=1 Tax=Paraburkholderia sp. MPAMCS5 TaxID=3112563 RepID=UPI002E182BD4|nr:MFS transporter [Paraburkholderia sp. MPAMCS5]